MLTSRFSQGLVWFSLLTVLLVTITSVLGLTDSRVYIQESENWRLQAQGQDIGNLIACVALLYTAVGAQRGSATMGKVWLGVLMYFIYAFLVYAMAVHLNYLFLVYVSILGMSFYLWAYYLQHHPSEETSHQLGHNSTFAAWTLVGIGGLFGMLWLNELLPALITGELPKSLIEAGLIVNPIHAIDLAVVLPGMIATGYMILRQRPRAGFWAVPWLAFSFLMGSSIIAAMALIIKNEGNGEAVPPIIMASVVVVLSSLALYRQARTSTT
jgi:hypothetical protein